MKYIAKSKSQGTYLHEGGDWLEEPYKFLSMVELLNSLADYYEECGEELPFDDTEVTSVADSYVVKSETGVVSMVHIQGKALFDISYGGEPLEFTHWDQAFDLACTLGPRFEVVENV